jgi:hypothetical protein
MEAELPDAVWKEATMKDENNARSKDIYLFRKKSRQLDEEALIEIDRYRSIKDTCKYLIWNLSIAKTQLGFVFSAVVLMFTLDKTPI